MTLLTLSGCAHLGRLPPSNHHVERPGYMCEVEREYPESVRVQIELDPSGRQIGGEWEWTNEVRAQHFEISAHQRVNDETPLSANEGFASMSWRPYFINAPSGTFHSGPRLIHEIRGEAPGLPPLVGNSLSLNVKWPLLSALARRTSMLSIILRREDGMVAYQWDIPSNFLAKRDEKIETALDKMRMLTTNFRNACEYWDDLYPEIIVT